jgi:hypothetical protein
MFNNLERFQKNLKTRVSKQYVPLKKYGYFVNLFTIQNILKILIVMMFFGLVIFAKQYLPFNEEVGSYSMYFFCIFKYRIFMLARSSKDYFVEHINDIN